MTGKQRFKTLQQGMTLIELSVVLLMYRSHAPAWECSPGRSSVQSH
jgi:hypothetical protein